MHWYVISRLPLKLLKDRSKYCRSVIFDHFGRGPAKREQHSIQKALHANLSLHNQTRMLTCACLRVSGESAQGASMSRGHVLPDAKLQQAHWGACKRQQTVSLCRSMNVHMG